MGYTTEFEGEITIDPPLNEQEIKYLTKFAGTRRMNRKNGPYYVDGDKSIARQPHEDDVIDYNAPPAGQPGLWCQWIPTEDGKALEWDSGEKFYYAVSWMQYLIDHFLGTEPIAKHDSFHFGFLQGHTANGTIYAQGEEAGDIWKIVVKDNTVTPVRTTIVYDDEK